MQVHVDTDQLQLMIQASQAGIAAQQQAIASIVDTANEQIQAQQAQAQQQAQQPEPAQEPNDDRLSRLEATIRDLAAENERLSDELKQRRSLSARDAIVVDQARNGMRQRQDGVQVAE